MKPVTDPALLAQLGGAAAPTMGNPVTDPALLAQLEGGGAPTPRQALPLSAAAAGPDKIDTAEGMPWYEKMLVGAGATADKTARGITGLLPEALQTEGVKQYLQEGKESAAEYEKHHPGGWATAGEIAGDVALSAIPVAKAGQLAAKASKLASVAKAAPTLSKLLPAAGDVAANAAYAAATAPEDRGTAALLGGGGAAAGRALPMAVGKVLRPVKAGPEAQKLIEAGVQPTFGQVMKEKGGLGRAVAAVEKELSEAPISGFAIRRAREKATEGFQKATREAALPPGVPKEAAETVGSLNKALSDKYDEAVKDASFLSGKDPFSMDTADLADSIATRAKGRDLPLSKIEQAQRTVRDTLEGVQQNPTGAHNAEKKLKELAFKNKSSGDPDSQRYGELLHDIANDWKDTWRGALPADKHQALTEVDQAFAKFVPVRKAAKGNALEPEDYTPKALLRAIQSGDKTATQSRFLAGQMPQQELAMAGERVLGSERPATDVLSRALRGAKELGAMGTSGGSSLVLGNLYGMPGVQRWLTGQAGKKWMEQVSKLSPEAQQAALRSLALSGRAIADQGQE